MSGAARQAQGPATFTMGRDWVVTSASVAALPRMLPSLNRSVWDTWPAAEPLYRPLYERAWADGHADGLVFFNGTLVDIHATVIGDQLDVGYVELAHIDPTTVPTLIESLREIRHLCRDHASLPPAPPPRLAPLQVVR